MTFNITVIGVGSLGSHVVQLIRNFDAKIKIIDFDRVEQKNVQSQFHSRNAVGKSKAQALAQLMQFLYNIKIDSVPHKLTNDNIDQLLKGSDILVDCLDNAESRNIVQKYARKNKIPCIHGCLSATNTLFSRVVWDESYVIDEESEIGAATCEDGQMLPFIVETAAFMARSIQLYLDSGKSNNFDITPITVFSY